MSVFLNTSHDIFKNTLLVPLCEVHTALQVVVKTMARNCSKTAIYHFVKKTESEIFVFSVITF